jgi:hypothetical protein
MFMEMSKAVFWWWRPAKKKEAGETVLAREPLNRPETRILNKQSRTSLIKCLPGHQTKKGSTPQVQFYFYFYFLCSRKWYSWYVRARARGLLTGRESSSSRVCHPSIHPWILMGEKRETLRFFCVVHTKYFVYTRCGVQKTFLSIMWGP